MSEQKRVHVDVVRVEEPWSIAHLADGTQVKAKVVFDQVYRVLDESGKPVFGPDGNPQYHASMQTVFCVNSPDRTKQGAKR